MGFELKLEHLRTDYMVSSWQFLLRTRYLVIWLSGIGIAITPRSHASEDEAEQREINCPQENLQICEAHHFAQNYQEIAHLQGPLAKQQQIYFIRRSVWAFRSAAEAAEDLQVQQNLLCQAVDLLRRYERDQNPASTQLEQGTDFSSEIVLLQRQLDNDLANADHHQCTNFSAQAYTWPPFVVPIFAPLPKNIPVEKPPPIQQNPLAKTNKTEQVSRIFMTAGIVSVSFAAAMASMLGAGLIMSMQATRRGEEICEYSCDLNAIEVQSTLRKGRRGEQLAWAGGTLGVLAMTAGVTFFALERSIQRRKNMALSIHFLVGHTMTFMMQF